MTKFFKNLILIYLVSILLSAIARLFFPLAIENKTTNTWIAVWSVSIAISGVYLFYKKCNYSKTGEVSIFSPPTDIAYEQTSLIEEKARQADREYRLAEAVELWKQAITLVPETQPATKAHYLCRLGYALSALGEDGDTQCFSQSLKIYQTIYGNKIPENPKLCAELGSLYMNNGQKRVALKTFKSALKNALRTLGPSHPDIAGYHNCLAGFYSQTGRIPQAAKHYNKAMKTYSQNPCQNQKELAACYANLGTLYINSTFTSYSEKCYKKALDIFLSDPQVNADKLAVIYANLAFICEKTRRYEESESLYNRAIDISLKINGVNSLITARYYEGLAILYTTMKRFEEAESLYMRTLGILKKIFPYCESLSSTYKNIAWHYKKAGNKELARNYLAHSEKV